MYKTAERPKNINFDVDGFSTSIEINEYDAIKTSIEIQLDLKNSTNNSIGTKKYYRFTRSGEMLDLQSLCSCKVGRITSSFGPISVYIIDESIACTENQRVFKAAVADKVIALLSTSVVGAANNVELKKNFRYKLDCTCFKYVFPALQLQFPNSFIFIENYGSKTQFSHSGLVDPISMLDLILDINKCKFMKVDIACQFDHGEGKTTFLGENMWMDLGIRPNYYPLFCESIGNLNMATVSKIIKNKVKYLHGDISKLNFYSQLEDTFSAVRGKNFFPALAYQNMQKQLYGYCHSPRSGKNDRQMEAFLRIFKGIDDVKPLGYRMEIRTSLPLLLDGIQYLTDLLERTDFNLISNKKLALVIRSNIDNIMSKFTCGDLDSVYNNIFLETLVTEWYLKGGKNAHLINKAHHELTKALVSAKYIPRLGLDGILNAETITKEMKLHSIKKMIDCNQKSSAYEKNTFNNFILLGCNDQASDHCRIIYDQYTAELANIFHPNVKPFVMNYHYLSGNMHELVVDQDIRPLDYERYIETAFFADKIQDYAFIAMSKMIIDIHGVKQETLVKALKRHFENGKVNLGLKLSTRKTQKRIFIRLSAIHERLGGLNRSHIITRVMHEIEKRRLVVSVLNVKWVAIEDTMLINGMMRYWGNNDKYKRISQDASYTFLATRTIKNCLHDRLRVLKKNKYALYLACKSALPFNPGMVSCQFREYMFSKAKIHLYGDSRLLYDDLVNIDTLNFEAPEANNITCFVNSNCSILDSDQLLELEEIIASYIPDQAIPHDKWDLEYFKPEEVEQNRVEESETGIKDVTENETGIIEVWEHETKYEARNTESGTNEISEYSQRETKIEAADSEVGENDAEYDENINNMQSCTSNRSYEYTLPFTPLSFIETCDKCDKAADMCDFSIFFTDTEHKWIKVLMKKNINPQHNPSKTRREIFGSKYRPTSDDWNHFLAKAAKYEVFNDLGSKRC